MGWRLRTRFGDDIFVVPEAEAKGQDAGGRVPALFVRTDLRHWLLGIDGSNRRQALEMYSRVGAGVLGSRVSSASDLEHHVLPALEKAFERGSLSAFKIPRAILWAAALPAKAPVPPIPAPPPPAPLPKVVPKIVADQPNILVRRPYTAPGRVGITLSTDIAFDGKGTLTCSGDAIRVFTANAGGAEIKFDGADNVFPGPALSGGGKRLFVEGAKASGGVGDVGLTLTLTPGKNPVGGPAKVALTSVLITLDLCKSRGAAGADPAPLPQPPDPPPAAPTDKFHGGRLLHVKDGTRGKRALMIIGQAQPKAFKGTLELTANDGKVSAFEVEAGGAAVALPFHVANSAIPANGKRLWIEGTTVSGGLRDTGFKLGVQGLDKDGDRVSVTVFKVEKVEASLRSTPKKRDGTLANSMPSKAFNTDNAAFGATALTLVENCGELKLVATVKPAAVTPSWDVQRATDDAGLAGLLTHSKDGSDDKRSVKTDKIGSFHLIAFGDANGNGSRGVDEDGVTINVTVVKIEVLPGVSNNKVLKKDTLFRANRSNAAALVVDSGSTAGVAPGVNAVYTDALFANYPLAMKIKVKLTGGGADKRRGVTKVGLGFIQQTTGDSVTGTYADGRTLKEVIAVNPALPDPIMAGAPAMLAFPVRDTRGPSQNGTGPYIISSSDAEQASDPAGGQTRVVRYVDPPAIALDATHPVTGAALASIAGTNDFESFLTAYSSDFDENYVAIAHAAWKASYGTFAPPVAPGASLAARWNNVGANITAPASMTILGPPSTGEAAGAERCPPNFVDNLKMDAR